MPAVVTSDHGAVGHFSARFTFEVFKCAIIAAFGGLMFGYDIGISGMYIWYMYTSIYFLLGFCVACLVSSFLYILSADLFWPWVSWGIIICRFPHPKIRIFITPLIFVRCRPSLIRIYIRITRYILNLYYIWVRLIRVRGKIQNQILARRRLHDCSTMAIAIALQYVLHKCTMHCFLENTYQSLLNKKFMMVI